MTKSSEYIIRTSLITGGAGNIGMAIIKQINITYEIALIWKRK